MKGVSLTRPARAAQAPSDAATTEGPVRIRVGRRSQELELLPPWVQWLIELGQYWQQTVRRRIALISMPCDSPAAGLVALGALIGDIADPRASDVEGHFAALIRYARQYLDACQSCTTRCRPAERRCGYASEATGKLRHISGRLLGPVLHYQEGANPVIRLNVGTGTAQLFPAAGQSYYVHHAPPIVAPAGQALDSAPYMALARGMHLDPTNLARTFSGTCFAGRAAGESSTRDWYDAVRFSHGGVGYALSDLLTLRGWGARGVSRMRFFNTRTGQFDRDSSFTRLVIADGHAALERVLSTREFDHSDVIAVVQRTSPDDLSRALGERLSAFRQWYTADDTSLVPGRAAPRGVAVQVLRQGN